MTNRPGLPGPRRKPRPFIPSERPAPILSDSIGEPEHHTRRRFVAYWCSRCRAYILTGGRARTQHVPLACGHNVSRRQAPVFVDEQGRYKGDVPRDPYE